MFGGAVRASATDSKSPNQERRQRRDRRLQFEAYEKQKRREEVAAAFNRTYFPDFAPSSPVLDSVEQAATPCRKKLFSEVPSIEGERIVLNRVVNIDAEALRDLVENPNVQRFEPTYLFEKRFDDMNEAIDLIYGDLFEKKESLMLAIRMKETGELAGLAEFYGLRDPLHKISIGYRLRECWWGKGLATETARLMVGYLYAETDIEIITASTMVENAASARVLEKADFIRTARGVEEDWGYPEPTLVDKWFC